MMVSLRDGLKTKSVPDGDTLIIHYSFYIIHSTNGLYCFYPASSLHILSRGVSLCRMRRRSARQRAGTA